jgi:hypothetical protein
MLNAAAVKAEEAEVQALLLPRHYLMLQHR